MNYLGHLYLSGNDENVIIGNFIADFVKGNSYKKFPEAIQKGILMHRKIDEYTDGHQSTKDISKILRGTYGKYSTIISDMLIDHVLATNWNDYHNKSLYVFSIKSYLTMVKHFSVLPKQMQHILPFLIQSNRLYSYSRESGILKAIQIMERYSSLPKKSNELKIVFNDRKLDIFENSKQFLTDVSKEFLQHT
ncbi:MAG: DUF479 domain-containing protein [Bacteroidales bacterium]|nr:DUF479 domain-containing protein [Bacteroidales bacterium]